MTVVLALAPVLAVIAAVLLAGCGSPGSPTGPPGTRPASGAAASGSPGTSPTASPPSGGTAKLTTITVIRTGGIAGVMQQVVISPDGSWTYTDRKTQATQSGKLTGSQSAQLAALISNPGLAQEMRVTSPPIACNDSFLYTIRAGELTIRYDQCTAHGTRPVTDQLVAAVLDATPL